MLVKEQVVTLVIRDLGSSGEGVGSVDGFTVFVEGGLPGEKIHVRIIEAKKNYAKGRIETLLSKSDKRVKPLCPVFTKCGGCDLQHLSYQGQLEAKTKRVQDALERIGHLSGVETLLCLSSPNSFAYRNKIQLPTGGSRSEIQIGFYQRKTHKMVEIEHCPIHCELGDVIFKTLKKLLLESNIAPYDEAFGKGELRNCLIKTALYSEEVLVTLVVNGTGSEEVRSFGQQIFEQCPEVKGVVINRKTAKNNTILGTSYETLAGRPYIYEMISGLRFKISSASFFQVNPLQAERLYERAIVLGDIRSDDIVIDAYCGVGTLSLLLARKSKKVIGIEYVSEAIQDAKENGARNLIENVEFYCGRTEQAIHLFSSADAVFLNPPRKGCHESVIQALVKQKIPRIVYISCNPATLARDLKMLHEGGYHIEEVQPFDMFPQTAHVETVASLRLES